FAVQQTQQLKVNLLERPIPEGIQKLNGGFESWLEGLALAPSVRFGVETAILNIMAKKSKTTLSALINPDHHTTIRLNGLLCGNIDEVQAQAESLLKDGFQALKLKVGGNLKEDVEKVKAVNNIIRGHALLHLDANQRWSFDAAVEFATEIGCDACDYIEEPFKDYQRIPEFFTKTFIPIALDESLLTVDFEELKSLEGVDFIILKPTVLGGVEKTCQIMERAKQLAISPILSSCYESEIGILTLAQIAGTTVRDYSSGLDTLKWFKKGLLQKDGIIEKGRIYLDHFEDPLKLIDFDLVTEIYDDIH
ncbi:MAG: o-succinylbenzoate synthase, partial [Candidatus Omnitrophica bacterium]|nr:o-succinylbenzoate synthase [Candidatus Omnitrophota bacterium]